MSGDEPGGTAGAPREGAPAPGPQATEEPPAGAGAPDAVPPGAPGSGVADGAPAEAAPAAAVDGPPAPGGGRPRRWSAGLASRPAAAALLGAAVVLHVVAMFPSYLAVGGSVPSLSSQSDQAALYGIVAGAWALALVATVVGPHRARLGAGLAVGVAATELGFRIADFGEALGVQGSSPGAGVWVMTAAWVVGAAGAAAAVLVARRAGRPAGAGLVRPTWRHTPALLLAAAASLLCAGTFLPAWDHFHAFVAANGRTADINAGNVFSGPWEIMLGNVIVAVVLAALPILAVLWRPALLGGAAVLGQATLFLSQLTAAAVQTGNPVSPSVIGLSPGRAQALGVRVTLTLTGWYIAEVVAVALVATLGALLVTMPDGWLRSLAWPARATPPRGESRPGWPGGGAPGPGPGGGAPWPPPVWTPPGSSPPVSWAPPPGPPPPGQPPAGPPPGTVPPGGPAWGPAAWGASPWAAWMPPASPGPPTAPAAWAPPWPPVAWPPPWGGPTAAAVPAAPGAPDRRAPLELRTATLADVDAVVALVESAYRGPASRAGWTTEADLLDGQRTDPEGVRAAVTTPGSRVLLAEAGGEIVACCQLQRHGVDAYFGMFAVRPALQGRGWGRAVLAEAERIATTEWHAPRMYLSVIAQRADVIAWYQRRGFAPTGETHPFPYGDERYGIPRRHDLAFVTLAKTLGAPSPAGW